MAETYRYTFSPRLPQNPSALPVLAEAVREMRAQAYRAWVVLIGFIKTCHSPFEISRLIHLRHGGAECYGRIGFEGTVGVGEFWVGDDDIVGVGIKGCVGGGGGEKDEDE